MRMMIFMRRMVMKMMGMVVMRRVAMRRLLNERPLMLVAQEIQLVWVADC
jgi:hypothetical protein